MPNYCDNKLEIKGSKENIKLFLISFLDDELDEFSMRELVPVFCNEGNKEMGNSRDIIAQAL